MLSDRPILFLALGETLVWACFFYLFPAMLLRWEQDLGWSKADLTAAIGLAILVSALVSPLAGRIIDQGRGATLMAGSALLGALGLVALSRITEAYEFYAVWAIIGIAMSGCLYEPCFALVTRARGAKARRGIVWITLVAGFASTISFPTVHVLAGNFGWRACVLILAGVVVCLAVPLLLAGARALEDSRVVPPVNETVAQPNDFLRLPSFWLLAFGFALGAVVHGATLHHLLPILNEKGVGADRAVLVASLIGPMQIVGRLALMASERLVSNHILALVAFLMMGLSTVLLLFGGSAALAVFGFVVLFGCAYGIISILRPLIAREILGEEQFGAKSGALALPFLIGSAISPYLGARIWGIGGYDLLLATLVVLAVAGSAMYAASHRMVTH